MEHELFIDDEERDFLISLIQMERSRFNQTSIKEKYPEYEQMTKNLLLKLNWDTSRTPDW